ncbi:glycoside hydrolase superfamily [Aspergillus pseudonomiae]|nr:glycoside hydrolase superfamily [Aspergillus pseudonomiae]
MPCLSMEAFSPLYTTQHGKTGYFAGSNSYWIGFQKNNDDVDLVFSHLQKYGLKILQKHGIKLIINFVNFWDDYNDINTYIKTFVYRAYIKVVISRYSDSTAIFIKSTSQYIKLLDSKYLAYIGNKGFSLNTGSDRSYLYQYSKESNFIKNLAIPIINFRIFHLYPSSYKSILITLYGVAYKAARKPYLFEEYRVILDYYTIEKPWQNTALNITAISENLY